MQELTRSSRRNRPGHDRTQHRPELARVPGNPLKLRAWRKDTSDRVRKLDRSSPSGIIVTCATRFSMRLMTSSAPLEKNVPVLVRTELGTLLPVVLSTTEEASIWPLACRTLRDGQGGSARSAKDSPTPPH